MVDPANYREVAIEVKALKESVTTQFAGIEKQITLVKDGIGSQLSLFQWIGGAIVTALFGLFAGGAAVWVQLESKIAGVDAKIGPISEKLKSVDDKLAALDTSGRNSVALQAHISDTLTRIERRLPGSPSDSGSYAPILLTTEEEQLVRKNLGLKFSGAWTVKIGEILPADKTKELPFALEAEVAKLKGTKLAIDSGAAIFVNANNRVVAIVPPM